MPRGAAIRVSYGTSGPSPGRAAAGAHRRGAAGRGGAVTDSRGSVAASGGGAAGRPAGRADMHYWLIKSDPEEYSADDLMRERKTEWTGVSNPVALKHLRAMTTGDAVLIYHTGNDRAIVALATVGSKPRSDPRDRSGKATVVDVEFDRMLARPVTLADVKAEPAFATFDLVRISRLSVMRVSPAHWKRILKMAGEAVADA